MWVGTFGGGLNRFDPVAGTAVRYRLDPEDPTSLSASTVLAIHEDHRGILLLGTENGLHLLDLGEALRADDDRDSARSQVVERGL